MEDLIHLAITMTEMDTGIELSLEERNKMVDKMLEKLKNTN
jgi:hypothetical protein